MFFLIKHSKKVIAQSKLQNANYQQTKQAKLLVLKCYKTIS
jgi:hypothetical protein